MEQQELISTGVADIASSLGIEAKADDRGQPPLDDPNPENPAGGEEPLDEGEAEGEVAPPAEGEEAAPPPVEVAPPPKSWGKDTHEIWSKIPPEAQAQILKREEQMLEGLSQYREHHQIGKAMNDVISPYRPMIQAAGLDDAKAVAVLLQAHYRLTQGSPQSRMAAYQQLGRDLGFAAPQQQPRGAEQGNAAPVDREARQALAAIQHLMHERTQHERAQLLQGITQEYEAFAKDHPDIEEIAAEVVAFIDKGHSLKDAYEKAKWANPASRAKEEARLQKEIEVKLREKAKAAAEAARKAKAGNVRSRDTGRTPTEPLGKMEDTMREKLREIEARTTH